MLPMTGNSIWNMLTSGQEDTEKVVFGGRERHSSSRYKNWGYPQRSVRKGDYMYIWNAIPERWPAGAPQGIDKESGELNPLFDLFDDEKKIAANIFSDIGPTITKKFLVKNHRDAQTQKFLMLACEKRQEFELYDVAKDMACLENLAGQASFKSIEEDLKTTLFSELKATNDFRVSADEYDTFDGYERYSPIRTFPKPDSSNLSDYLQN